MAQIAVVGDVHGHLALLYAILGRWQRESGWSIDLILQVGDLGAFAPDSPVDHATRRHADRDPEELGFSEFAGEQPPGTLLDPRPPLVFIPGNHEDFPFLEERDRATRPEDAVYPVAQDGKILALRSGRVWTFDAPDGPVRIAGVSGVAHRSHKKHLHPMLHLRDEDARRITERGSGSVDILASHERPAGIEGAFRHDLGGSDTLRLLIEEVQPQLAFFGHYDWSGESLLGSTRVVGLRSCGYVTHRDWPVKRGGIALVEWSGSEATVDRLWTEWLESATRDTWRRWGKVSDLRSSS